MAGREDLFNGENEMKPLLAMSILGGGARIYFVTRYTTETVNGENGPRMILKSHRKYDVTHLFELSRGQYVLRKDMDLGAQLAHYEESRK